MKYKAIICDLDGTTIPNRLDGMPSPRVIEAIRKASDKVHVSIATGRALWQAHPIIEVLQLSGPKILLNGALIINGSKEPIYTQALLTKDYNTIVKYLKKAKIRFTIDEIVKTVEYRPEYKPINPLSIFIWDQTEGRAANIIDDLSHIPTVALYRTIGWDKGTFGVNISHILATKQHAIYELARILDIETHEIIGIGDGPNDFPLLMACGLKIAMGNAADDLKAIADYVAPSVQEDGLAHVIEKFILDTNPDTPYNKSQ